jgi:hypothetical protein
MCVCVYMHAYISVYTEVCVFLSVCKCTRQITQEYRGELAVRPARNAVTTADLLDGRHAHTQRLGRLVDRNVEVLCELLVPQRARVRAELISVCLCVYIYYACINTYMHKTHTQTHLYSSGIVIMMQLVSMADSICAWMPGDV